MYKSQNKELLGRFKQYLKDNVSLDEAEKGYFFFYKKLYIDDLNKYLRHTTKSDISGGFGNYNSNVAIVLYQEDERALNFLKSTIDKANTDPKIQNKCKGKKVDYNGLYITYYKKALEAHEDVLNDVMTKELKAIKPQLIIAIGDFNIDTEVAVARIDNKVFNTMLSLMDKDELTEDEKIKLNSSKVEVWREIQKIIPYY